MSWPDYAIIVIVAVGAFKGFSQGIIRQIISIVGFSAGLIVAGQHSPELATYFSFIGNPGIANAAAFVVIVLVLTAVASLVGQALHRVIGFLMFGFLDKLLGAAFGALLSVLFVEVGLIILNKLTFVGPEVLTSSLVKRFLDFAPMIAQFLPPELESVRQTIGTSR